MSALKQERTAKAVLGKQKGRDKDKGEGEDGHDPSRRQEGNQTEDIGGGDGVGVANADAKKDGSVESAEENTASDAGEPGADDSEEAGKRGDSLSPDGEEEAHDAGTTDQRQQQQQLDDKEEKPLFSPGEAESLTTYLVERQQAFSLVNVADIQHGERERERERERRGERLTRLR